MSNRRDFFIKEDLAFTGDSSLENVIITGNIGVDGATGTVSLDLAGRNDAILVPKGTTAERPSSPVTGMIRYNTQLEQYELYDSVYGWVKIGDQPPEIASISPTNISTTEVASTQSITITGNGFDSGTYVRLVPGNGNTDIVPVSTTLVNSSELSITVNTSDLDSSEEPYDVRVVKASGLSTIAQDILYVDNKPVWSITPNQTIKTVYAIFRSAVNIQLPTAVDPDGDVVTYAATNLPSGLTANSTTGLISGSLADVSSDTTYSPTVKALSTGSDPGATQVETTRTVNIVQKAGIGNSLRFDGTSYLSRGFTGGNKLVHTVSFWVKRSVLGAESVIFSAGASADTNHIYKIGFNTSNQLQTWGFSPDAFNLKYNKTSNALYRDTSSWYHVIQVVDYSNQSGVNRVKLYVNGTPITSFSTDTVNDPDASSSVSAIGNSYTYMIGRYAYASQPYFSGGYLANIQFIDGQALSVNDFGVCG